MIAATDEIEEEQKSAGRARVLVDGVEWFHRLQAGH